MRAVASKPPPAIRDINQFDFLIGRDFGFKNTISLSVVRRDREIDLAEVDRLKSMDKEEALKYLSSHWHPMDNIVEVLRISGRGFLDSIAAKCAKIDNLASEISLGYNKLEKLKTIICGHLKLPVDQQFPGDSNKRITDPLTTCLFSKFFRLLNHIWHLKGVRLKLYAKIKATKKIWFGRLANIEAALAKKYTGAVIRENLSIGAIPRDDPGYKGRTFNKMINAGAKGQYNKRASGKHGWSGTPEVAIPSYYTSTTCPVHTRVDGSMRSGDQFLCPSCGKPEHADEHASSLIANYLLLRPPAPA